MSATAGCVVDSLNGTGTITIDGTPRTGEETVHGLEHGEVPSRPIEPTVGAGSPSQSGLGASASLRCCDAMGYRIWPCGAAAHLERKPTRSA